MIADGLFGALPGDAVYAFTTSPAIRPAIFGFRGGVMYSSSDTVVLTVSGVGGHGAVCRTWR